MNTVVSHDDYEIEMDYRMASIDDDKIVFFLFLILFSLTLSSANLIIKLKRYGFFSDSYDDDNDLRVAFEISTIFCLFLFQLIFFISFVSAYRHKPSLFATLVHYDERNSRIFLEKIQIDFEKKNSLKFRLRSSHSRNEDELKWL